MNVKTDQELWDKAEEAEKRHDFLEMLSIWKTLADKGIWTVCARIGYAYEYGLQGVDIDIEQALRWYRRAVFEADDPIAHVGLGRLYYKGNGVAQNTITACNHWKKAFDQGSADAALYLGIAYNREFGVKRDIQLAKSYFESATKADYFYAYGALGRIALEEKKIIKGLKYYIKGYFVGRKIQKTNPYDDRLLGINKY